MVLHICLSDNIPMHLASVQSQRWSCSSGELCARADNYIVNGTIAPDNFTGPDETYQPRWDA